MSRYLVAFGRFLWDFIIGDAPELAVGVLVLLGITLILGHSHIAGPIVLPLAVLSLLLTSVGLGKARSGG